MEEDRNKGPSERLHDILSGDDEMPGVQSQSPLDQLPRASHSKSPAAQVLTPQTPQTKSEPAPIFKQKWGPPFWTITGGLSLIVNVILIAVLLIILNMLGPIQGTAGNLGTSVLGGLYTNFEKMDRATIQTVIPVEAHIPLNITVPVQTTTQITLAEPVAIQNAQVQINTSGITIDSNARVTLPAGTPLIVNLDFDLPVDTTIPVQIDVPVNIPIADTELHEPFVGLQDVVQPLFCLVDSEASNLDGQAICR